MAETSRDTTGAQLDLDALTLSAWRLVQDASEAVEARIAAELEETTGLLLEWYGILLHVYEFGEDGRLPQHALERYLRLSQSGISRMVSKMQAAGLLQRVPIPHDRRNVYVVLTERGRDVFLRATPVHHAAVQRHFGDWLSKKELTAVTSGLGKVVTATVDPKAAEHDDRLDQLMSFGQSVLSLTSDAVTVSDAVVVRDALEPLVLSDAARHVTPAAVTDLRAAVSRMTTLIDSPEDFFRADWDLHRVIAGLCQNKVLRTTYLALLDVVSSHLDTVVTTSNLPQYLTERLAVHARLVDAVASGDSAAVSAAAQAHHFSSVRYRLVDGSSHTA
ncbi:FCD domain-containing protein [Mycobacterium sp. URHB0044]|uniref:FCD domain-containing protein n=1 Tax=Mycobacterium sp. URHB0044 TaxID=1380386 RepID=UPI00068885C4|nr:FCD domain-containing protein [Mycobacterium sp. URHB0044]